MVKLTNYYHLFNSLILSYTLKSPTKMTLVNMFLEINKVVDKVFIHEINSTADFKRTVFNQKYILLGPRKEETRFC